MPEQSLKQKTYTGFFWSFVERFMVQSIQIVMGIVLARLLFPSDYGLIGLMAIFIVLTGIFVESGLSNALVQKQNRTEEDFSTVFYFNIIVCIVIYSLIYIAAPFISAFYDTPVLTKVMRVYFLSLIINAFTIVQSTKLRIALEFKKKAICNLLALVISGGVGVWMAYSGYGVWSLVMQAITNSLVSVIVLTILVRWKPLLIFSRKSFQQLFGYGSKLLGALLIDAILDNLYTVSLGRYYSEKQVGYYTRGLQLPTLIAGTLSSMLENVTFPVLSSIQNDKEFLIAIYRRLIRMVSFLIIPAMVGLAFISESFVRYFLTEKWMPIVVLMQWMCFTRIFTPVNLLNASLLNAIGRSDLFLKMNLIRFPIIITILLITIPKGLEAVVIGHFIMSLIGFLINSFMPGKIFGYGAIAQIKDLLPAMISSVIMLLVLILSTSCIEHDLIKMIVSVIVGIASYLIASYILKTGEIKEIYSLIINNYKKQINRTKNN